MKKNLLSIMLVFLACCDSRVSMASVSNAGCSVAGVASASNDSICVNGLTNLLLTGYTGTIQWQSFDGSSWIDETGTGSTTDNYPVTLAASTDFRAVVTEVGCPPDTSNVISIVVGVAAPVTTGDTRCGYGQVTLSATGGSNVKWYDALTGGNFLYLGSPYITNVSSTTTFYASAVTNGGGSGTAPLPAQVTVYSAAQSRGLWFIAPVSFTITGLLVPPMTGTVQNLAVLNFTGAVPPPAFPTVTNAFTILFMTQNDPAAGVIPVNIPVSAGDVIGILGTRTAGVNNETSYGPAPSAYTSSIDGQPVTFSRMGMQFPLSTTSPIDIWEEPGGSLGRIEITYEVGCESTRTAAVATVTTADPVTISAIPPALCAGQSSTLSANSTSTSYTYTWSPGTGLSSTTGTPVTATPSSPITYTVIATDGTCGAIDSIFIDVGPLSNAGTATVTTDTICSGTNTILQVAGTVGNIQWQSNTGTGWVNETGTGNDSSQYQVSPTVNTDYWAVVTSGGCDPDTTILLHVEVLSAADPVTVDDTICGPGVVNLTASGTGFLSWFTSATGGTAINTGTSYAPNISGTTTYYVQAAGGPPLNVGAADNLIGSQSSLAGNDFGLQFDALQQATIEKIYVFPQQTGTVTINLRDAQGGQILNTVTVNVTAFSGKTPVTLGFSVNSFSGYRLELGAGSATCSYNVTGATYPYTVTSSPITITGFINPNFGTAGLYYFFYDWVVSAGCKSNFIPVNGVVLPLPPVPTISQNLNVLTSSSPTGNQWYLNGNIIPGATGQNYTFTMPGSYTVVVTDPNGCSSTSAAYVIVGVEEFENSGISVYPNPASEKLYINFPVTFSGNASVRIMNTLGSVVYELNKAEKTSKIEIDLKKFAEGSYMLEIETGGQIYRKVILKM